MELRNANAEACRDKCPPIPTDIHEFENFIERVVHVTGIMAKRSELRKEALKMGKFVRTN